MKCLIARVNISETFIMFNFNKKKIIVCKNAKICPEEQLVEILQEYSIQEFIKKYKGYILLGSNSYIYPVNE